MPGRLPHTLVWTTRAEVAAHLSDLITAGEADARAFEVLVSIATADELRPLLDHSILADLPVRARGHLYRALVVRGASLHPDEVHTGLASLLAPPEDAAAWPWPCRLAWEGLLRLVAPEHEERVFGPLRACQDRAFFAERFLSLRREHADYDAHHRQAPAHILEALLQAWHDAPESPRGSRWAQVALRAAWVQRHENDDAALRDLWTVLCDAPEHLPHLALDLDLVRRLYALDPPRLRQHARALQLPLPLLLEVLGEDALLARCLAGIEAALAEATSFAATQRALRRAAAENRALWGRIARVCKGGWLVDLVVPEDEGAVVALSAFLPRSLVSSRVVVDSIEQLRIRRLGPRRRVVVEPMAPSDDDLRARPPEHVTAALEVIAGDPSVHAPAPNAQREIALLEQWSPHGHDALEHLLDTFEQDGAEANLVGMRLRKAWCRARPEAARAWFLALPPVDARAESANVRWPEGAEPYRDAQWMGWMLAQRHLPAMPTRALHHASCWMRDTPSQRATLRELLHADHATMHRVLAAAQLGTWDDQDGEALAILRDAAAPDTHAHKHAQRHALLWLVEHRANDSCDLFLRHLHEAPEARGALAHTLLELAGTGLALGNDAEGHTALLREALRRKGGLLISLSRLAHQVPAFLESHEPRIHPS